MLPPSVRVLTTLVLLSFIFVNSQAQSLKPVPARIRAMQLAGVNFVQFPLFAARPHKTAEPANALERNTQYLQLDETALQTLNTQRPEAIAVELPWAGKTLRVLLYEAPVLTDNFYVQTSNQSASVYTPGIYYRGIIENEPGSIAAISFFEGNVIGVIAHPAYGNLNLGREERQDNRLGYVLFNDLDIPDKPSFQCLEREVIKPQHKYPDQPEVAGCVQVFFECDYALYQNKGSVSNTVDYVTGFFNVVSTLYSNETISIAISQIFVWTTPDSYPTGNSGDALDAFMAFRTSFTGDLAHLVGLAGNGLGGVAYLDVLCNSGFNYAYSDINPTYQSFPTYSWTVNVVAHEMGHNVASHHTHWCGWVGGAIDTCGPIAGYPTEGGCPPGPPPTNGGTIMSYCHLTSYGINFSNGFGTQPGDAMRNAVTGAGCLASSCPSNSCTAPTALTVTSITSTGATIGWNNTSGATSYNLQYRVAGISAWTTVNNAANPYAMTSLTPATLYEVQVQAVCGGNASPYKTGLLFRTATSACAEPSNIVISNLTGTTVDINWTENGSATQWEIQYGPQGFMLGSGTLVSVSMKPYTLTGLSGNTSYDLYVRSVCGGATGNSTWVGPEQFTTPTSNDLSTNAIELVVDQDCPGANIYSNAGAGTSPGEFSPTVANGGYWNTGINNTVWFKFIAPASGSVKITTDISPLGSLNDTQLALYNTDNPTTVNHLLVSNEDGGTLGQGYASLVYYSGLTPGTVYYIQVDGWNTQTGTFCIAVYETFALTSPSACSSYTQSSVNGAAAPDKWFNIFSKPNSFNIGVPIAAVKSTANLGTVTVQEIRYTNVQTAPNGVKYMQRYYNINSAQNSSGPKQVRLFYTTDELNNLKIATGMPGNTAEDLNISHYEGVAEDCTPNNNSAGGASLITSVSATNIGTSGFFFLEYQSPGFSEMAAVFGMEALPVELIEFRGEISASANLLYWATATEQNLARFSVERSPDGATQWREIGQQPPSASHAEHKNYAFADEQPLARSYYRLKIIDLDGSSAYSNIVALERAVPDGLRSLYPNPVLDVLFAEVQTSQEYTGIFRILGADGRVWDELAVPLETGLNILPFPISRLPTGLYYLEMPGSAGRAFVKY